MLKALVVITRLPNVLFIFIAQILSSFYLVQPKLHVLGLQAYLSSLQMVGLAIATALIAAAGYMINDYFDIKIDNINKPYRVTVETTFARRHILLAHIALSAIGLCIAVYLAIKAFHISYACIQILSIILLLEYSANSKRKPIIGNINISLLTALVVITPSIYQGKFWRSPIHLNELYTSGLIYFTIFAFAITWLREVVKDLEDIKGDIAAGCNTMPIKYGINASKVFCYIITASLLLSGLLVLFIKLWPLYPQINYVFYSVQLFLIYLPLIVFAIKLTSAYKAKQFKYCSRLLKIITFIGILSMVLF
jgi:4-hydroxybenzoate polyprenyltransferase